MTVKTDGMVIYGIYEERFIHVLAFALKALLCQTNLNFIWNSK